MSQAQIFKLLKSNPNVKFTALDIIYSIGLRKQRVYKNLRSLEKLDCIKKGRGWWSYVP